MPSCQHRADDRNINQEYRSPMIMLKQRAANKRAKCSPAAAGDDPQASGKLALIFIQEGAAQAGQRSGQNHGGANGENNSGKNQNRC